MTPTRALAALQQDVAEKVRMTDIPEQATVVTYSELDTFRQCPLKHHLAYRDLWARESRPGSALAVGTLWHQVMEETFRVYANYSARYRKSHAELVLAEVVKATTPLLFDLEGEQTEDQGLINWMFVRYLEHYGVRENWEILAVEKAGRYQLAPGVWLQFKIDLLVQAVDSGKLMLIDHKTAANFSRPAEIDIDDQFGLYTWALRKLGVEVFATIRSDARKQRNIKPMKLEESFREVLTYRTDTELENIAHDATQTAKMAWSAEAEKDLHSNPAPDRCTWRCDFLEAHLLARKGLSFEKTLPGFGFFQKEAKHREYSARDLEITPGNDDGLEF